VKVLELFCGSGALARGFLDAGIEITMAFDSSADACASYEANLGARPIQMGAQDLLRMLRSGWSAGAVDLLVADPPCAPWSRAGKREGLDDPRDTLEETIEIIRLIRPLAYLVGNVPGLQDSTHWPVVQKTIGSLSRAGYCVQDFAELDAVRYGVPQFRNRPFWYGHLAGPCISWPTPTHGDPTKLKQHGLRLPGVETLKPWVTCAEALGHLPVEEMGRLVRVREPERVLLREKKTSSGARSARRVPQSLRLGDPGEPASTLTARPARAGSGDSVVLALHPRHPISQPDAPAFGIGASDGGGAKGGRLLAIGEPAAPPVVRDQALMGDRLGEADAPSAAVTAKASRVGAGAAVVLVWPWPRPATTVCAGLDRLSPPGRSGSHGQPQSENAIVLSQKAATILQGLPENWVFMGDSRKARWGQLGQALPPPVAAAIARSVLACFRQLPEEIRVRVLGPPVKKASRSRKAPAIQADLPHVEGARA